MKKIFYKQFLYLLFIAYFISKINFSIQQQSIINNNFFQVIPNSLIKHSEANKNIYSHTKNEQNLKFIFSMFRHGARSPCEQKFINNKDILGGVWKGLGELTTTGRKQQYLLGLKNKNRYSNFISSFYDPKEILIYSTHFNRVMMSAQSQLKAFYNNISYDEFSLLKINDVEKNDNKIEINSILPPIHLFEKIKYKNNNFLSEEKNIYRTTLHYSYYCPKMRYQIKESISGINKNNNTIINKFIKGFIEKYGNIIKNEYKLELNNLSKPLNLKNFCDVYISCYFDNINKNVLNKFINNGINTTELLYDCFYYHGYYIFEVDGNYTNVKNDIIAMSDILRQIISWMNKKINIKSNESLYDSPKFVLISAHDTSLAMLQSFLSKFFGSEINYPYFASNLIFELREYNNKNYVEGYFNDFLILNESFDNFQKTIMENSYDNKYVIDYCNNIGEIAIDKNLLVLGGVFFILFIIFLFLIRFYFFKSKKYRYKKFINEVSSTK